MLTRRQLHYIMYYMKTVNIRDLQHHLGAFLDEVERGEVIEVRRNRKVIARITAHTEQGRREPWPDLRERLAVLFPDGPVKYSASERVYEDRGER